MTDFDPQNTTKEDLVYTFFNEKGIPISEDLYEYIDYKKVINRAVVEEYTVLTSMGLAKMEIYEELSEKYTVSTRHVMNLVT